MIFQSIFENFHCILVIMSYGLAKVLGKIVV